MRPIVLSIAGSDPAGGAGIQADIKAIEATGGFAAALITAITVQNTTGVLRVEALPAELVRAQLVAVLDDLDLAAIKTGMLANAPIVRVVAELLSERPAVPLVVDPVLASSCGFPLIAEDAIDTLVTLLFPLAELITPNVPEATRLTGVAIRGPQDAARAGRLLLARGAQAVLVTGGHLAAAPATDVLVTAAAEQLFVGQFSNSAHTHGGGCTFASAIATGMARGLGLVAAITEAKRFIEVAIRGGLPAGRGRGPADAAAAARAAGPTAWREGDGVAR